MTSNLLFNVDLRFTSDLVPAGLNAVLDGHIILPATYQFPQDEKWGTPVDASVFMLTPKHNLHFDYPITVGSTPKLARSVEERFYLTVEEAIEDYRTIPGGTIKCPPGGRSAEEMIEHLKGWVQEVLDGIAQKPGGEVLKSETETSIFPVYNEAYKEFFVNPVLVPPTEVIYRAQDKYKREQHLSQFLTVPVKVPNYLGLCTAPGQEPFGPWDEVDQNALCLLTAMVYCEVDGKSESFFADLSTRPNTGFCPDPSDPTKVVLNMSVRHASGLGTLNWGSELIGPRLFTNFKQQGYDPLISFGVHGSFDRQRNALLLTASDGGVKAIRSLGPGGITLIADATPEQRELMDTVKNMKVVGVKLHQQLK